ncbi:MAG TPA: transcription elongation factor GreA, partial [Candidatus Limnocylindrales bacterium]|nr:transcription elongation factor GreA [Candidatus Limnocylindrales bacterium]
LFREIGLLADGPVVWGSPGRPVPARGPGVFVVELVAPLPRAPIELTRVGKWIERVETLRLDGERPTSKALAARMAAFWLPSQTVVYIGSTTTSIGGRIAAMQRTVLGDRKPSAAGQWLGTLLPSTSMRVWWAQTEATEEYEDALLAAFAGAVPADDVAALPDRDIVLPWANLRRPTGERRATGLAGSSLVEEKAPPAPPTRVVVVPDGDAEGARGEPVVRTSRAVRAARPAGSARAAASPVSLTAEGAERLRGELAELTDVRRPEVIARIRTAKEHGDLKENAEYHAAREEQSFLEGRIQALEARLRAAVITEAPAAGEGAGIGSRVTVELDGLESEYTLVGSAEADPKSGRLSVASPVGKALLGSKSGDDVDVETPRGRVAYRVLKVE